MTPPWPDLVPLDAPEVELLEVGEDVGWVEGRHSCVVVDDPSGFDEVADRFLEAGRRAGLLPLQLSTAAAVDELYGPIAGGRLDQVVDQFTVFGRDAVAQGYRGLCAAVDVSMLLATPATRDLYRRYEVLIDRRIRQEGTLHGLCVVDRSLVEDEVCTDVCHLHGQSNLPVDFTVTAEESGGSRVVVTGEVDSTCADGFARALAAVAGASGVGPLVIRLDQCRFLDHRALLALDEAAAGTGARARLEGATVVVAHMIDLLELRHVEVAG